MAKTWTSLVKNATYDRCVVMVAATKKTGKGFDLEQLKSWEDSWQKGVEDPDGLTAYNLKTGKRELIAYEGIKSEVWRIHDGTWVDVIDQSGALELKVYQQGMGGKPNRRYGPWYNRQEEGSLKPEHYGFPDQVNVTASPIK
ncbi:MAG: hypothetical protein U1F70_13000 [Candidatus Competibacteraceae bacterium]